MSLTDTSTKSLELFTKNELQKAKPSRKKNPRKQRYIAAYKINPSPFLHFALSDLRVKPLTTSIFI